MRSLRHVHRRWSAGLVLAVAVTLAYPVVATAAEPAYARDGTFDQDTVIALAKQLASAPYARPASPLPSVLANIDYDQYRDIRVAAGATFWAKSGTKFRLQLLPRGFLFVDPVEIALVAAGKARHVAYRSDMFSTGTVMKAPLPTEDIGFSGLRLQFPINRPTIFDEVAVFQGASYFRAVGAHQVYGLSARGLANKTADPQGEEFPAFRAFWVEEPSRTDTVVVVHALLDSPSAAGAFRFRIDPGRTTVMEVEAVLFPRVALDKVGLSPMTSMFMFSSNGRAGVDDFRPEVHDSDGLLIVNGRGEQIWRPLANPAKIQVSAFLDKDPRGFGLMQRDRSLADYQDFEAHYEKRPSLWVEPLGSWGEGSVMLTEIPSDAEIHDNIVAFWRPKTPLAANAEFRYGYRLLWGEDPKATLGRYRVAASRRGRSDPKAPTPVRQFVVDYVAPAGLRARPQSAPVAQVSASAGEIKHVVVVDNPLLAGGYRVSFVFDPKDAEVSELRIDLTFKDGRSAETWMYRWTGS